MDAKIALQFLSIRANSEFQAAEEARKKLADACAIKGSNLTHLMDTALVADANAKPWADLFVRIERHGVREGLAKMRQKATEALVDFGIALSTSLVTNAERLAEQNGLRRFLSCTNGMDIDEDQAPAEEAAPESEVQPEPAPAPVEAPAKVTPAQKRTLKAIRDTRIELQETRVGQMRVIASRQDAWPRKDMVLWVIEQGWAQRDHSTSLYDGQAVSLTEVGEAILAG
ncbi:hypothetical protein ACFY0A_39000 [Streptomyces sp. NPDC001698]|uniref:hypothetical protein n=1 Tax=Streptomyces sp. NPDC001698 TaxID=3364601 RepID=UPI0036BC4DD3